MQLHVLIALILRLPRYWRNDFRGCIWSHCHKGCATFTRSTHGAIRMPFLRSVHPEEWREIEEVLTGFRLKRSYITVGGGNRSLVSRTLDGHFYSLGWVERHFDTALTVDEMVYLSPTHSVDCYKNHGAIEVEWNNKDPFFDRPVDSRSKGIA